ncbi:MAG: hypothetical protein ACQESN_03175 [Thermotogota bacterium]
MNIRIDKNGEFDIEISEKELSLILDKIEIKSIIEKLISDKNNGIEKDVILKKISNVLELENRKGGCENESH